MTLTVADLITLSFQSSSVLFNTLYSLSLLFLLFVVCYCSTSLFDPYKGLIISVLFTTRLAYGLLSGALSGNQTYIKCIGVILKEYGILGTCHPASTMAFPCTEFRGSTTV